jgi:MYXO-CTERM domain-containing protein
VTVQAHATNPVANCLPFGSGASFFGGYVAFIYQNVPSFTLNPDDKIGFDLGAVNDADIVMDIALAATTTNGGGQPVAAGFTQVVTAGTASSRGDTIRNNYELEFTATTSYSFPGGGLIIRFKPQGSYLSDSTCTQVLVPADSTDTSNFFVMRVDGDADGVYPWDSTDLSNIGQFRITYNTPPTAQSQSITTGEDTPTAVTLVASDPESQTLTWSIVSGPAHGTLSGSAPNLTYLPSANYNGTDSFTFRVNDGTFNSSTATVSITVTPVNDAPVASDASRSTAEDTAVAIALSASDVDGDALIWSIMSAPTSGALSGTAPNLTYTPNPNFKGWDSFTFRVNDGTVDSNTATVSITVTPVNDAVHLAVGCGCAVGSANDGGTLAFLGLGLLRLHATRRRVSRASSLRD